MYFTVLVVCLISNVFSQSLIPTNDGLESNGECDTKSLVKVLNNLVDVLIYDTFNIKDANAEEFQKTILDVLKSYLKISPGSENQEILNKLSNFEGNLLKDHSPTSHSSNEKASTRTIAVHHKNLSQNNSKKQCNKAFNTFLKLAYTAYKQLENDPICRGTTSIDGDVNQAEKRPELFKETFLPHNYDRFVNHIPVSTNPHVSYSIQEGPGLVNQYESYGKLNVPSVYSNQNIQHMLNPHGSNGNQNDLHSHNSLNYQSVENGAPKEYTARPKPNNVNKPQATVNINKFLQGDLKANVEHAQAVADWYKQNEESTPAYTNKPFENMDLTKRVVIKDAAGNVIHDILETVPGSISKNMVAFGVNSPKNIYDKDSVIPPNQSGLNSLKYYFGEPSESYQSHFLSKIKPKSDLNPGYSNIYTQNRLAKYLDPNSNNFPSPGPKSPEVLSTPNPSKSFHQYWDGLNGPKNLREINHIITPPDGPYEDLIRPNNLIENYDFHTRIPNNLEYLSRQYGSHLPMKFAENSYQLAQSYKADQNLPEMKFSKLNVPLNQYQLNAGNYNSDANLNYKNISSNVENDKLVYQSGVSNQDKLKSGGIIELTYVLKPKSVMYQPLNLVKYRLPYVDFLVKLKKLLISKPYLLTDSKKLYHELLSGASETELTSNLGDITKEKLHVLTYQNGELVNTKIVNENHSLDELLKLIVKPSSNLPSATLLRYIDDLINYVDGKVDKPPRLDEIAHGESSITKQLYVDHGQYHNLDPERYQFKFQL